jgi:hypothetical protein
VRGVGRAAEDPDGQGRDGHAHPRANCGTPQAFRAFSVPLLLHVASTQVHNRTPLK